MSNLVPFRQSSSTSMGAHTEPAPAASLSEALLDTSERLKLELQKILSLPVTEFGSAQKERMNNILRHLLHDFLHSERERRSENTWASLESNWRQFESWCDDHGQIPLPAQPAAVAAYIEAVKGQVKNATLGMYRWAISSIHQALGLPDPTSSDLVKRKFEAAKKYRVINRLESSNQASALRLHHLLALQEAWGNSDDLRELRDVCAITLAFEGMLRESELAAILVSDLYLSDDGSPLLRVPFTKTDKSGDPTIKALCPNTWTLLQRYIDNAGLPENGLLFTGIHHKTQRPMVQTKPLTGKTIDAIFQRVHAYLKAQMPVPKKVWSGHSGRVGAAQDMLAKGYSIAQAQQAGCWKSPLMVLRYGQDIMSKESGMAQMMISIDR
ncbi:MULTISPECIES: tyrosine-type recombinase/integrase [Shewanella]